MATAIVSRTEVDDEEESLKEELHVLQKAKKEIVERARPFSEELATIAQREAECIEKLHHIGAVKKHRQADNRPSLTVTKSTPELSEILNTSNVTESEINHMKLENIDLKQSLDQAAKQSEALLQKIAELETAQRELDEKTKLLSTTKEELNETRQRLSNVQERLTVAEEVTAATQQRALQESGISEQLQLSPQHQPTAQTG